MNKCQKCGKEFEGNFCPNGCQSKLDLNQRILLWFRRRTWWQILIMVLVAIGLIFVSAQIRNMSTETDNVISSSESSQTSSMESVSDTLSSEESSEASSRQASSESDDIKSSTVSSSIEATNPVSSEAVSTQPSEESKVASQSQAPVVSPTEPSEEAPADPNDSVTVYIAPKGDRYHYDPDCGGENAYATTLSKAKAMGRTPCKKCAS